MVKEPFNNNIIDNKVLLSDESSGKPYGNFWPFISHSAVSLTVPPNFLHALPVSQPIVSKH